MKILHTADIHLGVKVGKLPPSKQKLIREEEKYNIKKLFIEATDKGCDVVIICGDLFHGARATVSLMHVFYDAVKDFEKPVVYIKGNHDEKFDFSSCPENLILLDKNNNCYKNMGTNFFYAVDGGKFSLNPDENNVLMLHGNIENTSDNDYIDINQFLNQGFSYIAMGHIHQMKQYKTGNCIYAYPGSLFSNGFDECGDKGYLIVEIENNKVFHINFCSFATRKFLIAECDISGLKNNNQIEEKVKSSLKEIKATRDDLVRVILKGKLDEDSEKSQSLICEKFDDYFYFELIDNTSINIDMEKYKEEKLSFKYEFIKLVEESELSLEDKNLICQIGIEALKGDDLSI